MAVDTGGLGARIGSLWVPPVSTCVSRVLTWEFKASFTVADGDGTTSGTLGSPGRCDGMPKRADLSRYRPVSRPHEGQVTYNHDEREHTQWRSFMSPALSAIEIGEYCLRSANAFVYCLIAAWDIWHDESHYTSPSWYKNGFCISWYDHPLINSHMMCVLSDVSVGSALMLESVRLYRRYTHPNLRLAIAVSAFTVMHGFGHAFIGLVLGADFMR